MRYTCHFFALFLGLLGGLSLSPAEETPGWRPKAGLKPPAVLTMPVSDTAGSFDWRDDLYEPLVEEAVENASESTPVHKQKWCSCPTCSHCGGIKPPQARYKSATENRASFENSTRFTENEQPLMKRFRFAIQSLTELR